MSVPLAASIGIACSQGESDDDGASGADAYTASGTCDGLPKLNVTTPPGVCVGLVYQAPTKSVTDPKTGKVKSVLQGIARPRGIAQLPGQPGEDPDFIVADMGGWGQDLGGVWRLHRQPNKTFTATQLFAQWDKPSGVQVGPDGLVYVGTPANIVRFDPRDTSLHGKPRVSIVIGAAKAGAPGALPSDGRHPLRHFIFDKKDPHILYVNIGSFSDVCESAGFQNPCPEAEGPNARGTIRKYTVGGSLPLKFEDGEVIARGLRNSMALEVHPKSDLLLQGENSRDTIDLRAPELDDWALPHEELNVIEKGAHYGWPYCRDDNSPNPEYRDVDCKQFRAPTLLLPAHASPLGMRYYFGDMFPAAYRGQLIVGYHSGHENGHRLAVVPTDPETGKPTGEAPKDLIRGWDEKPNKDPRGAPVDVRVAQDGSIYLTEDLNHTILRVFFDKSGDGQPMTPLEIKKPALSPEVTARCKELDQHKDPLAMFEKQVVDKACARSTCHGRQSGPPGDLQLLMCDAEGNAKRLMAPRPKGPPLVTPNDPNSVLVKLINGQDGLPQMPAGGLSPEQTEFVSAWIEAGAPAKMK